VESVALGLPGREREPEASLHYCRFLDDSEAVGRKRIDRRVLKKALYSGLPNGWTASCEVPPWSRLIFEMGWRANLLMIWMYLNNFARNSLFVVVVRDSDGTLVHRSTVIGQDLRKGFISSGYEVTQVWTDPRFRGRRIAKTVLASLLEAGPGVQFHWLVRAANTSSISVAEGMGFVCRGNLYIRRRFGMNFY
jgi:GNAT superfamily N-acetyltransferase